MWTFEASEPHEVQDILKVWCISSVQNENLSYSEISQNDVSFQMIRSQIQFLQRWIAKVNSRTVFIQFNAVFVGIQLILCWVVLNN